MICAFLSDKTHDVAYVAEFETSDGWKYHVRLGPMTKEQWFQVVGYEANIFESPEEARIRVLRNIGKDCPRISFIWTWIATKKMYRRISSAS